MNYYGIIPARYASVRFPGKPLAMIGEKTMIQHVYERAIKAPFKQVVIATEDERIFNAAQNFGAQAVMTQPKHLSGTDRCHEAAEILKLNDNDIVVNIQGDEPFIRPDEIRALTFLFTDAEVQIATLIKKLTSPEDIANPNIVKVVTDISGKALYFSRFPIPYLRHPKAENPISFYKHIGIYAYRMKTLAVGGFETFGFGNRRRIGTIALA